MNQDPRKREMIRKWIDGYRGKIICFDSDEGDAYHIVFDKDEVIKMRSPSDRGNTVAANFFTLALKRSFWQSFAGRTLQ